MCCRQQLLAQRAGAFFFWPVVTFCFVHIASILCFVAELCDTNKSPRRDVDQGQVHVLHTSLSWGHSCSIPQWVMSDVQPFVQAIILANENDFPRIFFLFSFLQPDSLFTPGEVNFFCVSRTLCFLLEPHFKKMLFVVHWPSDQWQGASRCSLFQPGMRQLAVAWQRLLHQNHANQLWRKTPHAPLWGFICVFYPKCLNC